MKKLISLMLSMTLIMPSVMASDPTETLSLLISVRDKIWEVDPSQETLEKINTKLRLALELLEGETHQPEPITQELIDACTVTFDGRPKEDECIQFAHANGLSAQVITACEVALDGDSNEFECLRKVAAGTNVGAQTVTDCELAMDGDANELRCIEKAGQGQGVGSDVINLCEAEFDGDENELSCISIMAQKDLDSSLIKFCADRHSGDAAELSCLQNF